jgi:hypothetical protein
MWTANMKSSKHRLHVRMAVYNSALACRLRARSSWWGRWHFGWIKGDKVGTPGLFLFTPLLCRPCFLLTGSTGKPFNQ